MPPQPQFEYDAFLSHASADKTVVRELAERLKGIGLRVWLDEWVIRPGDSIPLAIEHGLETSRTLVLVMSRAAFDSDWVGLERHTALFRDPTNRERRFIPLRLDDCEIKDSLRQFAYVDWREKNESQFKRLVSACSPRPNTTPVHKHAATAVRTLLEHNDRVHCVSMSADGTIVISGGDDRDVQVWTQGDDGPKTRYFGGHTHYITGVAVSVDGRTAITASYDGRLKTWDLETNTEICAHKIMPNGDPITKIATTPDCRKVVVRTEELEGIEYFAISRFAWEELDEFDELPSGFACCITVLDLASGDVIGDFNESQTTSKGVAVSFDGKLVAFGTRSNSIDVCDLEQDLRLSELDGHYGSVNDIVFIPDTRRLVSCSHDQTIRIWDYVNGKCLYVLEGHKSPVVGIQLIQNGRVLVSCGVDGTVITWNPSTGKRLQEFSDSETESSDAALHEYLDERTSFSVSSDGQYAVTASNDSRVRHITMPHQNSTFEEIYYTNAKVLMVGDSGVGKSALAIRLTQNKFETTLSSDAHWATQLRLPHDEGDYLKDREIWLWDFAGQADYRLIHQLFMDETALAILVFNPQSENPIDGLSQWDRDLARAARRNFGKLLVAGRCDRGGLMVSRNAVDTFAKQRSFANYVETSALTGEGCDTLRKEIVCSIDWDSIPWTASPRVFKLLKDQILQLRDEGVVLLRMAELKQQLEMRLLEEAFSIDELRAVVGLLAGPGIVWKLNFGDVVLLQPEWLNRYAAALIRSVRAHAGEIGVIDEGRVLAGDLNYTMDVARRNPSVEAEVGKIEMQRLGISDEAIVLRAMHQMLIDYGLCVREEMDGGSRQLIFPSYFKEELPTDPGHPQVLVKYQFEGHAEEIYATLVVQLWHTKAFEHGTLWKYAADFKSNTGARLGLKMARHDDKSPEISLYFDPEVQDDTKVTFIKYVHEHLLKRAQHVVRLRTFICPNCGHPVRDTELAREILHAKGASAEIRCQQVDCDKRFSLWDVIEQKFASKAFQLRIRTLEENVKIIIDNESRELILEGHARVITGEAGQIYRGYTASDHGIDGEIEFKDDDGKASGKRLYLQLKSGDSYLYERKSDGAQVFRIKKPRWETYWRSQAYPVMLVIRTSNGDIRWMNVSKYLEDHSRGIRTQIKEIKFEGEPFTALNVQRLRDQVFSQPTKLL